MKCKFCGKEFEETTVEHSKSWDRGDGVMYGSSSYTHHPVCLYCGGDNSMDVYLKNEVLAAGEQRTPAAR